MDAGCLRSGRFVTSLLAFSPLLDLVFVSGSLAIRHPCARGLVPVLLAIPAAFAAFLPLGDFPACDVAFFVVFAMSGAG